MQLWRIINDQIHNTGIELSRFGESTDSIFNLKIPRDCSGVIAFTRTCFSIGDWGIISALPFALKQIYPNCKIFLPSSEWCKTLFGEGSNGIWKEPWKNGEIVFKNNPYVDHYFNIGELKGEILTDHIRKRKVEEELEEPLIEQIFRALGASEEEIKALDLRPMLFFDEDEIKEGEKIIEKYTKGRNFGTLLLHSSRANIPFPWSYEIEKGIIEEANECKDLPFFYYTQDLIENTRFNFLQNGINFKDLNIDIRIQMYIKSKALINIGYQSGINDSVSTRTTKMSIATPYESIHSNITRGVKYFYKNGVIKTF